MTDPAAEPRVQPRSDLSPNAEPFTIQPPSIRGFTYRGDLAFEFRDRRLSSAAAIDLLDDMLAIRELEEMIVRLRSGGCRSRDRRCACRS